jgi:hypothetical protein
MRLRITFELVLNKSIVKNNRTGISAFIVTLIVSEFEQSLHQIQSSAYF